MKKPFSPKRLSHLLYTLLAFFLTALILLYPSRSLTYALNGLTLWFDKMIPVLFPFMVLSGIMIRMDLTDAFVRLLRPILAPVFRLSSTCLYVIAIGFLCGFPMGAHVTAQLYERKQLSRAEASLLLAFCNNIGPVYFLSFALPASGLSAAEIPVFWMRTYPAVFLMGMYGLPLLYGLFLRYTIYRRSISCCDKAKRFGWRIGQRGAAFCREGASSHTAISLPQALDEAVFSGLNGIARLGGYMIFFNLLFLLPSLLTQYLPSDLTGLIQGAMGCVLEITGGIGLMGGAAPLFVLCILPFGGLSCIAQTYSMIKNTDLSLSEYVMHKAILTAVTVFYYFFLKQLMF